MARACDLTGKRRLVGNNRSHSNIKTKRRSQVNLHTKRIFDPESGQTIKLRVSSSAIRTLDKAGSLSKYLRKTIKKCCGC